MRPVSPHSYALTFFPGPHIYVNKAMLPVIAIVHSYAGEADLTGDAGDFQRRHPKVGGANICGDALGVVAVGCAADLFIVLRAAVAAAQDQGLSQTDTELLQLLQQLRIYPDSTSTAVFFPYTETRGG